jgi:two-component system, cell cycle response regulator CpdR
MQKILVVEDDPEVSEFLAAALTGNDRYGVVAAANGNAALSLLEAEQPDLALIDVQIPGVPGIEVGQRAVALDVPVVLMTGDLAMSDQLADRRIRYLLKPFHLSDLFDAVERELARAEKNCRVMRRSLARLSANRDTLALAHQEAEKTVATIRSEREARQAKEKAEEKIGVEGTSLTGAIP